MSVTRTILVETVLVHIAIVEIVLVVAVAGSVCVHTVKNKLSRIRIINLDIAFGLAVDIIYDFHQLSRLGKHLPLAVTLLFSIVATSCSRRTAFPEHLDL